MAEDSARHIIAIIGAGIAGPVLALTILAHPDLKQRYKPIIYERLPCPVPATPASNQPENNTTNESHSKVIYAAGAAVALTSNALFPLYELGLKSELDAISCETERIKIWRAYGGKKGSHKYFNQINHPNWQEDLGTCLRVVERGDLQRLVLEKVQKLGGEIVWGKKLKGIENLDGEGVKVWFEDGEENVVSLVVGADGGWSGVRKFICEEMNWDVDKRWKPYFSGADGIYGVSKQIERPSNDEDGNEVKAGDTHWVLLDSGTASTWALPGGRQFWTISFPSKSPPNREPKVLEAQKPNQEKLYGADVTLGGHSFEETEAFLQKFEDAWHPAAGNFGELFRRSERIVRAPLWYRAWEEDEIGEKNAVLIGDASRLMLPSSGQGISSFLTYYCIRC
jgi:FAD-dependent urate hydroxylase